MLTTPIKGQAGDPALTFAGFRLEPSRRRLTRDGQPVRLGDRALDILTALVRRPGEVVGREALFEAAWPGLSVDESNLRVHIAALRKALGDGIGGVRLIASVPGRGYCFVAEVGRDPPQPDAGGEAGPPLPAPLSRIVGRETVLTDLSDSLDRHRLVTVTGAGGIGKTAVALAVAERVAGRFRDGARFIDLAPLTDPALVPAHLASLLRLRAADMPALDAHLRGRRLLLVLDNCEHLVGAVSNLVEQLLKGAPELHVLATSREPLRAEGERACPLGPLEAPPRDGPRLDARALLRYPAVQLLVERVQAIDPTLSVTDADGPAVAELCARLDGIPLAIELAATRVPMLGFSGVAERLDDRFALLTRGRRTAMPRHQTLTALIDWSYGLLDEAERRVWRRLSAFGGVFTLQAALALGADDPAAPEDVADILGNLIEKSLIAVDARGGAMRYRMLETLRLYAFGKLLERGEADCVRRRHAELTLQRCLAGGDGEIADIRAALAWAFSDEGDAGVAVALTAASAPLWSKLLLLPELRAHLERALAQAPDDTDPALISRLTAALGHAVLHIDGPVDGRRN